MRLPGYMYTDKNSEHLYIRLWHPGFWWAVWQEVSIEPRWLKLPLFAYIMVRMIWTWTHEEEREEGR